MRILIAAGSQSPPTFIGNLMNGLLQNGITVFLMGGEADRPFIPARNPANFKRVITDNNRWNGFRFLFRFICCLRQPGLLYHSYKRTNEIKNVKLKIKRTVVYFTIHRLRPDIIHVQWPTHISSIISLLGDKSFKFALSVRGTQINILPMVDSTMAKFYRDTFPFINGFQAVSQTIAEKTTHFGVSQKKIKIIRSPIPGFFFDAFEPERIPSRTPLKIVSIGRFHWIKGYGFALDAMKLIKEKGIQFKYSIVAKGRVPDEILHQIADLGISSEVEIIQGIDYGKIPEFLKANSILILPSISEGIANVVLEAMAVGLPVISTDCGGMKEVIENGQNGWLVPTRAARELADCILNYCNLEEEKINQVRLNAHNRIKNHFNEKDSIKAFIDFYKWIQNDHVEAVS